MVGFHCDFRRGFQRREGKPRASLFLQKDRQRLRVYPQIGSAVYDSVGIVKALFPGVF
jgi:hypothetical protein